MRKRKKRGKKISTLDSCPGLSSFFSSSPPSPSSSTKKKRAPFLLPIPELALKLAEHFVLEGLPGASFDWEAVDVRGHRHF